MASWYLEEEMTRGLYQLQLGTHPPGLDKGDPSREDCKSCHRPRDGFFQGTVGDLKDTADSCPLCHGLINLLVAITQEPHQRAHPFRLEVRRGSCAVLHVCVAVTSVGDTYEPHFARYQVFILACKS